jgi:hypothetical protein
VTPAALIADMWTAVAAYEQEICSYASRTRQMLERHGAEQTLMRLVTSSNVQKGLRTLAQAGKADLSFEAVILKYDKSFPRGVVEAARWRLEQARLGLL